MAPITSLYGALSGLLLLTLAGTVIARRHSARIGLGDGGDAVLARRIRAHGNAAETLPLGLLLLLLLELGGTAGPWLHGFGAALLLGRLLHAWGLSGSGGVSFGRYYGMLLTLLVLAGMVVLLLLRALGLLG